MSLFKNDRLIITSQYYSTLYKYHTQGLQFRGFCLLPWTHFYEARLHWYLPFSAWALTHWLWYYLSQSDQSSFAEQQSPHLHVGGMEDTMIYVPFDILQIFSLF